MSDPLVEVTEAAAMVQPLLGKLNAYNWLSDMRRKRAHYTRRVFSAPRYVRVDQRNLYYKSEILRIMDELVRYKHSRGRGS